MKSFLIISCIETINFIAPYWWLRSSNLKLLHIFQSHFWILNFEIKVKITLPFCSIKAKALFESYLKTSPSVLFFPKTFNHFEKFGITSDEKKLEEAKIYTTLKLFKWSCSIVSFGARRSRNACFETVLLEVGVFSSQKVWSALKDSQYETKYRFSVIQIRPEAWNIDVCFETRWGVNLPRSLIGLEINWIEINYPILNLPSRWCW